MNNPFTSGEENTPWVEERPPVRNRYWLHLLLFVLTLGTTTLAGAELATGRPADMLSFWEDYLAGLPYSLAFLCFLTVHEFGHYFTALYHGVRSSLPYFIPVYLPFSFFNIGSMGAVIRMRETPATTRKYFDIGIAGPLAGFVVAIILLWYGFAFMPGPEYLYGIHPEYSDWFGGKMPTDTELQDALRNTGSITILLGDSLIFQLFAAWFGDPDKMPGAMEMYHYPFLFVGYLTLFFTALNLLPIGQLDGGHVIYGLLGRKTAGIISRITVILLASYGGLSLTSPDDEFHLLYLLAFGAYAYYLVSRMWADGPAPLVVGLSLGMLAFQYIAGQFLNLGDGATLWLVYSFLAVRVIGVDHPPALIEQRLNPARVALGIGAIIIFILCFTPDPLSIVTIEPALPVPLPAEEPDSEIVVSLLRWFS